MTDQEAVNIVRGQAEMIGSVPKEQRDPMTNVMVEAMRIVVGLAQDRLIDKVNRQMLRMAGGKNDENKNDDRT